MPKYDYPHSHRNNHRLWIHPAEHCHRSLVQSFSELVGSSSGFVDTLRVVLFECLMTDTTIGKFDNQNPDFHKCLNNIARCFADQRQITCFRTFLNVVLSIIAMNNFLYVQLFT